MGAFVFSYRGFSRRAFSVVGPAAWNSLPDYLRDPTRSVDSFRRDLKTLLFSFYWRTQRIRGFAIMHYTNLLLTLTLTCRGPLDPAGGRRWSPISALLGGFLKTPPDTAAHQISGSNSSSDSSNSDRQTAGEYFYTRRLPSSA